VLYKVFNEVPNNDVIINVNNEFYIEGKADFDRPVICYGQRYGIVFLRRMNKILL
jgi:hypothetical protein